MLSAMETLHISSPPTTPIDGPRSPGYFTREEHMMKEKSLNRGNGPSRQPRRSQTVHEYQPPAQMPFGFGRLQMPAPYQAQECEQQQRTTNGLPSPIAEVPPALEAGDSDSISVASNTSSDKSSKAAGPVADAVDPRPRRPMLPPPRRSYSVMDYEPLPHHHRPTSSVTSLSGLPSDVHFNIFDFLDPLDSTCLGLTNSHFYDIHRRMNGTVPLSIRRAGPNDMEWAWHLAGTVRSSDPAPAKPVAAGEGEAAAQEQEKKALEKRALSELRVRGHAYCRKCGISRCELHKHIQGWMGERYEYCSVRQKFGPKAPEGARGFCYLSNPKKPGKCGRHRKAQQTAVMTPA